MNWDTFVQLLILFVLIFYLPKAIARSFRVVLADYVAHKWNYVKRDKHHLEIDEKYKDEPGLWMTAHSFQNKVVQVSREAFLGENFESDFDAYYNQIAEEADTRYEENK